MFGYFLSSEEHGPGASVEQARLAEDAGFDEVYVTQVGPTRPEFLTFRGDQVLPRLR